MPRPLGRIEREVILAELEATLPCVAIEDSSGLSLPAIERYRYANGRIIPYGSSDSYLAAPGPLTASFLHRSRVMTFSPVVRAELDGVSLEIPDEIVPEADAPTQADRCSIRVLGRVYICDFDIPARVSQGEINLPDDAECVGDSRAELLAVRLNMPREATRAGEDILRFVSAYRESGARLRLMGSRGLCVFLDHLALVAALPDTEGLFDEAIDASCDLSIVLGARALAFPSRVLGVAPLTRSHRLVSFDCSNSPEEDKRFLYERIYGTQYG